MHTGSLKPSFDCVTRKRSSVHVYFEGCDSRLTKLTFDDLVVLHYLIVADGSKESFLS